MISPTKIHELATQQQTSDINVAREYLQHLFLSLFYKKKDSDKFLFKGGTAIRIVFGGPRYSEDLDFSASKLTKEVIENLLIETFSELNVEGITNNLKITDANPTVGGYIANIDLDILGFKTGIKSNIQIKEKEADLVPEPILIENAPFLTAYSLVMLSSEVLVKEKVQALIQRFKPRDFYDLYYFLRHDRLKNYVPRDEKTLQGISSSLDRMTDAMLDADLRDFIPINQRAIVKTLKSSIRATLNL